jgi:hypothetical protein
VTGVVQLGSAPGDGWIALSDGNGFIAMVNLSPSKPPELVTLLNDQSWVVDMPVDVWATTAPDSALMDRVRADTTLKLVGLTADNFIEVKLPDNRYGYLADGKHAHLAAKLAPNLPKLARGFGRNGKHWKPKNILMRLHAKKPMPRSKAKAAMCACGVHLMDYRSRRWGSIMNRSRYISRTRQRRSSPFFATMDLTLGPMAYSGQRNCTPAYLVRAVRARPMAKPS